MNAYNEISYRYVKAPLEFYVPNHWRGQSKSNRQASDGQFVDENLKKEYNKAVLYARNMYDRLLEAGVAREIARGLLPLCTYSEFIFTCNLHSLMHFIRLRLGEGAQQEISVYAQGLLELALPHFPVSLEAFGNKIGAQWL